jgi:bifunctional DNA-binding transcriptional regulator/antitoxin component of YhaV-PrlF toxin-antitoxin module
VGVTRISSKNQTTLPVAVLDRAGLGPGDEIRVEAIATGQILLTRAAGAREQFAGCLTGVYGRGYLSRLRREWR